MRTKWRLYRYPDFVAEASARPHRRQSPAGDKIQLCSFLSTLLERRFDIPEQRTLQTVDFSRVGENSLDIVTTRASGWAGGGRTLWFAATRRTLAPAGWGGAA